MLTAGPARSQGSEPPVRLVLGTATPGGGFPVYGDAFIGALGAVDPTLTIEARNTAGSTENIPLLEAGKLDLGLVQGEPAFAALSGIGRQPSPLKVLTAMYATAGLFVVRADSQVRTISDLRGQAVALGARGSGLTILGRLVLEAVGIDPERDIQAISLERAGDGPAMVLDGRVAALWGGGVGWPGFAAVAASPQGARFIAPSGPEIVQILGRNANLRRLVVPAGTYRGQDAALESVGSWSLVLARPDLDEAVGYRLARALDRGRSELARRLPVAGETTPANTAAAVPAGWLQPGTARYLRETRNAQIVTGLMRAALAMLLLLVPLGVAGAQPVAPDIVRDLAPTGRLRAAINYGNPVLAHRADDGTLDGISVDLARELGSRLGLPVDLVPFDAAGKVSEAAGRNVWDVAFLAVDPKRGEEIAFTAPYVIIEGTYLVSKASPLKAIADVDRPGVRIAVGRGSAYDLFLSRQIRRASLVRATTSAGAVEMFAKDGLEVAAGVKQPLVDFARTHPDYRVMDGRFMAIEQAMGVPQGRPAAIGYLRAFVEETKRSGLVASAVKRHRQPDAEVAPPAP